MPRFAANLSLLFTEYPLPDRFTAARAAGFQRVELLFPYEMAVPDLKAALLNNGLDLVLINTPAGNWAAGERGLAAVPEAKARFREGFLRALEFARALDTTHVHVMAGISEDPKTEATFIENLRWATAEASDRSLTIEPINAIDMPGYALSDFNQAARFLDAIAAPNLHLQFDADDAHRITGDVLGAWKTHGHRAAHVQIGGYPGRNEPTSGEIDYPAFFNLLDTSGYTGIVSGEYFPEGRTEDGLGWLR